MNKVEAVEAQAVQESECSTRPKQVKIPAQSRGVVCMVLGTSDDADKLHCTTECHLQDEPSAGVLHSYALSFSKDGKCEFYLPTRTLESYFGWSRNTVIKSFRVLVSRGFFILIRKGNQRVSNKYTVLTHKQWADAHPGCCRPRLHEEITGEPESSELRGSENEPQRFNNCTSEVQKMNLRGSENAPESPTESPKKSPTQSPPPNCEETLLKPRRQKSEAAKDLERLGKRVFDIADCGLSGRSRERAAMLLTEFTVDDVIKAFIYFVRKNPIEPGKARFTIQSFFGSGKTDGCGVDAISWMLEEEDRQARVLAMARVPENAKPLYEPEPEPEEEFGGTGLLD
jgi:hypothetical protein